MFRVHGKGIGFARASIMGLWFSSCVREILIPINFLLKKMLETVENSNKMCRIFAFYYFALLRLGAKMLMIKKKSHVKKTHFRGIGTRSSLRPFKPEPFSDSVKIAQFFVAVAWMSVVKYSF